MTFSVVSSTGFYLLIWIITSFFLINTKIRINVSKVTYFIGRGYSPGTSISGAAGSRSSAVPSPAPSFHNKNGQLVALSQTLRTATRNNATQVHWNCTKYTVQYWIIHKKITYQECYEILPLLFHCPFFSNYLNYYNTNNLYFITRKVSRERQV